MEKEELVIGRFYKAYCGSVNPVYTIRLDEILEGGEFCSSLWRFPLSGSKKDKYSEWTHSEGYFSEIIEIIPYSESEKWFPEHYKTQHYEIY